MSGEKHKREPRIHSHIEDCLIESHPLAEEWVKCKKCADVLHVPNECMQTWIESGEGNFCISCFAAENDACCLGDDYGLDG